MISLSIVDFVCSIDDETAWREFKNAYEKDYPSKTEEELRKKIFLDNKRYAESKNDAKSELTFVEGVNELADLTTEEVNKFLNGFRLPEELVSDDPDVNEELLANILTTLGASLNETDKIEEEEEVFHDHQTGNLTNIGNGRRRSSRLDWRDRGRVSRVKHQGLCGSCWAFATTGALEGILARRNKNILLSEQNLVDCSLAYGNHGCNGGLMDAALRYVHDHGIMSSKEYKYTGKTGRCLFKPGHSVMTVRGSLRLPRNEALVRLALRLSGPIPVAVDASLRSFHLYKGGIYNDHHCQSRSRYLNHAVLLVGYGTDYQGVDYWIIKNSWGKNWGEAGFMRLARRRNLCGVTTYAILPIP